MTPEQEELGKRVRTERKKRKLTIPELAELAGVTRNTIGGFERGKSFPQKSNLDQIMKALSIHIDENGVEPTGPTVDTGGWSGDVRVALNVIGLYLETFPAGEERDAHIDALVKAALRRAL